MSTTLNVTFELAKEDRQRVDNLIGNLNTLLQELHRLTGGQTPQDLTSTTAPADTQEEEHPDGEELPFTDPVPAKTLEPASEPEGPKYTLADIRSLVQKLAAPTSPTGKRAKAKAIVKSYGTKVSDIPEDKYEEVMAKLVQLDKEG